MRINLLLASCSLVAIAGTAHADACDPINNATDFIKTKFAVVVKNALGTPGETADITMQYQGNLTAPKFVLVPGPVLANVAVSWKITTDAAGTQELANPDSQVYRLADLPANTPKARQSIQFHPTFDRSVQRFVVGTLTLTTNTPCTKQIMLPPVAITQPVLAVPHTVMAFREINFGTGLPEKERAVLLWTNGGPLDATRLKAQVTNLLAIATTLRNFADFNAYIEPLQKATALAIPNVLVKDGSAVADLNGWWPLIESWPAHVNCEDIFRSMIVIGSPGSKLALFNNKNFATDQGALEVTVGPAGVTVLPDLAVPATGSPPPAPPVIAGSARVTAPAQGSYVIVKSATWPTAGLHNITTIGGEISSMKRL